MALAKPQSLYVEFSVAGVADPVATWHDYPAGTYVKQLSPEQYAAALAARRAATRPAVPAAK